MAAAAEAIRQIADADKKSKKGKNRVVVVSDAGRKLAQAELRKVNQRTQSRIPEMEKDISDVMLALAAPGLMSEVRLSSVFTTGPTSVAQLHETETVSFGTPVSGDALDSPGSSTAFVFRDPVRHSVIYNPNRSSNEYIYNAYFCQKDMVSAPSPFSDTLYRASGPIDIALWKSNASADWSPHGDTLGVGMDSAGYKYTWLQEDSSVDVVADVAGKLRVYKWHPKGSTFVEDFDTNAGVTATYLPPASGYYRFEIYNPGYTTQPLANLRMQMHGTGSIYEHHCLVNYDSKALSVEKVRILSAGLLFTNTTPAIALGGKIAQRQFPGDEPWYEYAELGYDSIAKLSNTDVREASNGGWGFLKPTTVTDLEMTDNVDVDDGILCTFAFDLESPRAYLGYYAVLPANDATGAPLSAQITTSANIEFESSDQWYQTGTAKIVPDVFDRAIYAVGKIQQFDENPLHLKDVLGQVRKFSKVLASGIQKYGPMAVKLASAASAFL